MGVLLGELQSRSDHDSEQKHYYPLQELHSRHEPTVTTLTDITQVIMSVEGRYSENEAEICVIIRKLLDRFDQIS
jgi:hypothetical protein